MNQEALKKVTEVAKRVVETKKPRDAEPVRASITAGRGAVVINGNNSGNIIVGAQRRPRRLWLERLAMLLAGAAAVMALMWWAQAGASEASTNWCQSISYPSGHPVTSCVASLPTSAISAFHVSRVGSIALALLALANGCFTALSSDFFQPNPASSSFPSFLSLHVSGNTRRRRTAPGRCCAR